MYFSPPAEILMPANVARDITVNWLNSTNAHLLVCVCLCVRLSVYSCSGTSTKRSPMTEFANRNDVQFHDICLNHWFTVAETSWTQNAFCV